MRATADPGLHVFGELLECPSMTSLSGPPGALLRLFAYGTYSDYCKGPGEFPTLSEAHVAKLRRLSVISLACGRNELAYGELRRALGVESVRDVERVVLDCVYAGLLSARMDQRAAKVEIISVSGRDVIAEEMVGDMLRVLRAWAAGAEKLGSDIDAKIRSVNDATAEATRARSAAAAEAEAVQKTVMANGCTPSTDQRFRDLRVDMYGRRGDPTQEERMRMPIPNGRSIRSRFDA